MARKRKSTAIAKRKTPEAVFATVEADIERHVPNDQKAIYTNHFVIQSEQSVFHLLCFQLNPPMLVGTPEQVQAMASKIKSVEAECVAHLVIPSHQMGDLVAIMKDTLDKHIAKASGAIRELVQQGIQTKNEQ
jgi:hypothetical protein